MSRDAKAEAKLDLTAYYGDKTPNPFKYEFLPVGAGHTLYVSQYGNPNGIPIVLCHGGPGSGSSPKYAKFLDPKVYRFVVYDQRGCGKSTPPGELKDNNTHELIEDLEKIRKHLSIQKWIIFGGSWGSTLALLYAEKYPQLVTALVLRGVFLARPDDIYEFFSDHSPAAKSYPAQWQQFKEKTAELAQSAKIEIKKRTNGEWDLIDTYYQLLNFTSDQKETDSTKTISYQAAMRFSGWEKQISYLVAPTAEELEKELGVLGLSMGRIEIHFSYNKFFLTAAQQIMDPENLARIQNIPTRIVQGIHDQVCPANQAHALATALKNVVMHRVVSGHSTYEPNTIDGLMKVLQKLPSELGLALKIEDTKAANVGATAAGVVQQPPKIGAAVAMGLMPLPSNGGSGKNSDESPVSLSNAPGHAK